MHNPLIVQVPGGPEGQVAAGMAELIDVAPTLCEFAEVEPTHRHFGRSLVPVVRYGSVAHRVEAFSEGGLALADAAASPEVPFPYDLEHGLEAHVPVSAGKVAAIRTPAWSYVHRVHESPELYDRLADPAETTNLAADPAHRPILDDLRTRLLTWQIETADVIGPADPRLDRDGAVFPRRSDD